MKRHLLWIIPIVIVLGLLLYPLVTGISEWDGKTTKTVSVQVIDDSNNHPVSGATVYLRLRSDRQYEQNVPSEEFRHLLIEENRLLTTSADGRAELKGTFGAGGGRSGFRNTASFNVDAVLRVTHPDFRPSEGLLQSYVGSNTLPLKTSKLTVTIFLRAPNVAY